MNDNRITGAAAAIPVLYEDDHLMAFNKPAGLLVIPTPKKEKHTLQTLVNHSYGQPEYGLHPCHRLDRDTSGVILFAKGKRNQQVMMDLFKYQKIKKTYITFVHGRLRHMAGEIKSVIKDFDEKRFHKKSAPKLSITRYKVLEVKKKFCVVEVTPLTGRTNQIRIQFSEMGHPLVGERKYAFGRDYDLKFRRTALHALNLQFIHPIIKRQININSPLPEDMGQFRSKN